MATRKYYDCVFCKRGFTTAQALGGHMNIHKKDRPCKKASLPPSRVGDNIDKYLNHKPYPSIHNHRCHPHFHYSAPWILADHQDRYLAGPSRTTGLLDKLTYNAQCYKGTDQRGCNLLGGDWRPDLRFLRLEPSNICASKRNVEASTEENELDLELRIGRHP